MRDVINRLAGPFVDQLIDQLETRVTEVDHRQLVDQLSIRLTEENSSYYGLMLEWLHVTPGPARVDQTFVQNIWQFALGGDDKRNRFESVDGMEELQLAACLRVNLTPNAEFERILQENITAARWQGTPTARSCARFAFAGLFVGLRLGIVAPTSFSSVLFALVDDLPLVRWFSGKGRYYGTSFAYLSVLECTRWPGIFPQAGQTALALNERLMRHIEVLRKDALSFKPDSLPDDASPLLEKLRYTVGLLEAAQQYSDLRYLNTALKSMDWHHQDVKSILKSSAKSWGAVERLVAWYYIYGVYMQEQLIENLV